MPVGVFGTLWAYRKLRDNGERQRGRIDWWGNITFAVGLGAILIAITNGIPPTDATPWAGRTPRSSACSPVACCCSPHLWSSRAGSPSR